MKFIQLARKNKFDPTVNIFYLSALSELLVQKLRHSRLKPHPMLKKSRSFFLHFSGIPAVSAVCVLTASVEATPWDGRFDDISGTDGSGECWWDRITVPRNTRYEKFCSDQGNVPP